MKDFFAAVYTLVVVGSLAAGVIGGLLAMSFPWWGNCLVLGFVLATCLPAVADACS